MRVIHYERRAVSGAEPLLHVEPLCGAWGSMDTDWTDVESAVTCGACTSALRVQAVDVAQTSGRGAVR